MKKCGKFQSLDAAQSYRWFTGGSGIQIIAAFNTDVKNIDKALLRKGRLSVIHEFKLLALDRTNTLLNQLGHNIEVTHPLSAADIFNFETSNNHEPKLRKAVGFGN